MFWFQGPSCSVSVIANRSFWRHTPRAVLCFWLPQVPRASQIKGCWCAHHHMLGCWLKHHIKPCAEGQQAKSGWGRPSHMILAVYARTDVCRRGNTWGMLAQRFMTAATVETLWAEAAVDLQTPVTCTVLGVMPSKRLWHASQSLATVKSV